MTKEIKALKRIENFLKENCKHYKQDVGYIREALQRLETIDRAKPSEALECLEKIKIWLEDNYLWDSESEEFIYTIKQALIKAQEMKKKTYLKWEDLEFKDDEQEMKVILNGSVHFLCYYRNMFNEPLCMIDNTGITIWKENKNFFNDLHLERVE